MERLEEILQNTSKIRVMLVVGAVYYGVRYYTSNLEFRSVPPPIEGKETPIQKEYVESGTSTAVWVSLILFALLSFLRYININAEVKAMQDKEEKKE